MHTTLPPIRPPSRHTLIALIAAIQFVYILDFMLLLPLGPDVAHALQFPADRLSWLSAAYTLASVVAGLVSLRLLDRYRRKPALLLCFGALTLCTVLAGLATDLWILLWARALTGLFGGPATALAMALIIDATPPPQRGAAIGKVMLGFSLAVVTGIPAALELARLGNWSLPFFCLSGLATLVWLLAARLLPLAAPPERAPDNSAWFALLKHPALRTACLIQAGNQFSCFLIIPVFSAFFILNLDYPRDQLGTLYLVGGLSAMLAMQVFGRATDRYGPLLPVTLASCGFAAGLTPLLGWHGLPLALVFILFMSANAGRNVSLAACISQIPSPQERARFLALQSVAQDIAITLAALTTMLLLDIDGAGKISGMPWLALLAILTALLPLAGLLRLRQQSATASAT